MNLWLNPLDTPLEKINRQLEMLTRPFGMFHQFDAFYRVLQSIHKIQDSLLPLSANLGISTFPSDNQQVNSETSIALLDETIVKSGLPADSILELQYVFNNPALVTDETNGDVFKVCDSIFRHGRAENQSTSLMNKLHHRVDALESFITQQIREQSALQRERPLVSQLHIQGNNNVVNVTGAGSIQFHQNSDVTRPLESQFEDVSSLSSSDWKFRVSAQLEELSPDRLKILHDETRALRHDRLQTMALELSKPLDASALKILAKRLQAEYSVYTRSLNESLGLIVLASFQAEFEKVNMSTSDEESLRKDLQTICSNLTSLTNRFFNLLEVYQTTIEQLLMDSIEECSIMIGDTIIDSRALLEPLERYKCFYARKPIVAVFSNLLRNAFASVATVKEPLITLSSNFDQKCIVTIRDNGVGIPHKDHQRIFEDGFSTKGTEGFGLAHSRKLMDSLGGTLRLIQSKPKQGSIFEVTL